MESLDIDGIVKIMNDPKTASTVDGLLEGMDEMQKVMDRFEKIMQTLERMNLAAPLTRMLGKKMDVDVDKPLGNNKGIIASTKYHETVYNQLNTLSEEQIATILTSGVNSVEVPETVIDDDPEDN